MNYFTHINETQFTIINFFLVLLLIIIGFIFLWALFIRMLKRLIKKLKQEWCKYQTVPIKNGLNNLKKLSDKVPSYLDKYNKFCNTYSKLLNGQAIEISNTEDELQKIENNNKIYYLFKLFLKQKKLLSAYSKEIYSLQREINECMQVANNAYLMKSDDTQRFINFRKLYSVNGSSLIQFKDIIEKEAKQVEELLDNYNKKVLENPVAKNHEISEEINKKLDLLYCFVKEVPSIMLFVNTLAPTRLEVIQSDINRYLKTYAGIFNRNNFVVWKGENTRKFKVILEHLNKWEIDNAKELVNSIDLKLSKFENDLYVCKITINKYESGVKKLYTLYKQVQKNTDSIIARMVALQKSIIFDIEKTKQFNKYNQFWVNIKNYIKNFENEINKPTKQFPIHEATESVHFLIKQLMRQENNNIIFNKVIENTRDKKQLTIIFNKNKETLLYLQNKVHKVVVDKILAKNNITLADLIDLTTLIEQELSKTKINERYLITNLNTLSSKTKIIQSEYQVQMDIAKIINEKLKLANKYGFNKNQEFVKSLDNIKELYANADFIKANDLLDKMLKTSKN